MRVMYVGVPALRARARLVRVRCAENIFFFLSIGEKKNNTVWGRRR